MAQMNLLKYENKNTTSFSKNMAFGQQQIKKRILLVKYFKFENLR
jgi:hypothetical protein